MKIVFILTYFATFYFFNAAAFLKDGRDSHVQAILDEINVLIRQKYNLTRLPLTTASPESLEATKLFYDDVRFTVDQAKSMLHQLKRSLGLPVDSTSNRVYPYYQWTLPIKWAFDSDHTTYEREIIRQGMAWWTSQTCVTFQEYATAKEIKNTQHFRIIKGEGCWSYMGSYFQRGQDLSLGYGCYVSPGTPAHEFGHLLGLQHEHMRPDRDSYLRINWENIIQGYEYNFFLNPDNEDVDFINSGYEPTSIMQYDSLGFSIDYWGKKRTMEPYDPYQISSIGQSTRLSFFDVKRINYFYNCQSACSEISLAQPCKHGGYQDPKNCQICRCPPGTGGQFCEHVASSLNMPVQCGGTISVPSCSKTTLMLPLNQANLYNTDASCTWRIVTPSCGLAFGFETKPDMCCSSADTCLDFVEIRTAVNNTLTTPGKFFCTCGKSTGRIDVDGQEAYVHFRSTDAYNGGYGFASGTGFQLTVYATCGNTPISQLTQYCNVATSGYDGSSTWPQCPTSSVPQGPVTCPK